MSEALAVHHGDFGRAALYLLDKPMVTHAHREGHLIFYIGKNVGDVTVEGDPVRIDQSRAAAVSPWAPHSFAPVGGPCLNLVLYIKPMWFLEASRSAEFALRFGRSEIEVTPPVELALRRLTSLLLELDGARLFDGYLYELASLCFEQSWRGPADHDPAAADGPLSAAARFSDYRVRRSMRLMQEHFAEDIDMDWLAKEAGLSRPHFFKLFRRQMRITPNIYLNTLRTERAIDDLMETSKSVTEISHDLGFSSQASFTRFFSSNVGIPPSDYRRVAHVG